MNSPVNDLYVHLRGPLVKAMGEGNVYDFLPGMGTRYPFCFLGECYGDDLSTKWGNGMDVSFSIHFFDDEPLKRGRFFDLMNSCLSEIKAANVSNLYGFSLYGSNIRVTSDNSTAKVLLHGILELNFRFL